MEERTCPFCGQSTKRNLCPGCERDITIPRRICTQCGKQTPRNEALCCHCGQKQSSELKWKIPVIILIFLAAIILTIIIEFSK